MQRSHHQPKRIAILTLWACSFLLFHSVYGQIEADEKAYQYPADSLVSVKLRQWKALKFGLFMHWGPYSQRGLVESWTLCPEDYPFCGRSGPDSADYFAYKRSYEGLQNSFNPTNFHPEKWAMAAKAAGMRYMVFTTKHHDGFCMYDTHQTDYKITSPHTPYSSNPQADVTKALFDAFRKEDLMVGAYFSKPDWHSPYFWWPYFPPKDRHPNYDIEKYPARWQQFCAFTASQIDELARGYGRLDLFWFDGDWVKMDMKPVIASARRHQPGLIVVERHGDPQLVNYLTPEQKVPDHFIAVPWETCMTMGESWSYKPEEHYKPARKLIQLLVDIVAKNGNLLLNIGPGPDGDWHAEAYERLHEIGAWVEVNGEAIFNTHPLAPYRKDKWAFTANEQARYAIYLPDGAERIAGAFAIPSLDVDEGAGIQLLGVKGSLKWKKGYEQTVVQVPAAAEKALAEAAAWVFRIEQKNKKDK
jgi:alpha-L-fucosidase